MSRRIFLPDEATAIGRLSVSTFAWYQFSREANTEGLREAYARSRS